MSIALNKRLDGLIARVAGRAGADRVDTVDAFLKYRHDPLGFVLNCFPWGQAGSELAKEGGPDEWQRELLAQIGNRLSTGELIGHDPILAAVSAGNGPGKSTLVAWMVLWSLSTMVDARVVITANTDGQLRNKTSPELARWWRICASRHLFEMTATSLVTVDKAHERTWRADLIPWNERTPEAFAGLHNRGRRITLIYDEASAIPESIWSISEGALTDEDTEIIWLAVGNPTRPSGRFFECFNGQRNRWIGRRIDTRTVKRVNQRQIEEWATAYGEHSDWFKMRVTGEFPSIGASNFISRQDVLDAAAREVVDQRDYPWIVAVDIARFGTDASVILTRQGRDARTIPLIRLRGADVMHLASRAIDHVNLLRMTGRPIFLAADGGGVGGGFIDRCRQLGHDVIEVGFGNRAVDPVRHANMRVELWSKMREWLKTGCIEKDDELITDLAAPEYHYDRSERLILESKQDMKRRGLASPDAGDALAISFAVNAPVAIQHDPRFEWASRAASDARRGYDPRFGSTGGGTTGNGRRSFDPRS